MTITAQLRKQKHSEIRKLIVEEKLSEALSEFKNVIHTLGTHIGLLCDYAGCFYEMGRFHECWEVVKTVEQEYNIAKWKLSEDSQRRTLFFLGKFYEEMAEPAIALNYFHQALNLCDTLDEKKWVFSNELRLLSYFQRKGDLQKKYLAITEMKSSSVSLKIETLHGLMWAEYILFGYEQATSRWKLSMELPMNKMDKRLINRDFIEICILSEHMNCEYLKAAQSYLLQEVQLDYDKALIAILKNNIDFNIDELSLSVMMRVRLLLLQIKLSASEVRQSELRKKYFYLLEHLSKESQDLFKRINIRLCENSLFQLILHVADKKLIFSDKTSLKLTSMQVKFLTSIADKKSISLEQVSQKIWEMEDTLNTYHRLRMLVYKLNNSLLPFIGLTAFEVKKEGIFVHEQVSFKIESV